MMSRNLLLMCLMLGCTQVILGLEVGNLRVKRTGLPALDPIIKSLPFVGQLAAGNVAPVTKKPSAPFPNPIGQIISYLTSGRLEPGSPDFNSFDKLFSGLPGSISGRGSITLPTMNVDDLVKMLNNGKPLNTLGPAMDAIQGVSQPQADKFAALPSFVNQVKMIVCGMSGGSNPMCT